jgi:hypothetical protein
VRTRFVLFAVTLAGSVVALPTVAAADVGPPRQISVDPIALGPGQHETAVEPDSISSGNTIVGVFQIGRFPTGGASGIGWATSNDGGATWTSGVLPALTAHAPSPGPFSRASDPAVAYDRVHGTFLANVLALRDVPGNSDPATALTVSRSSDGLSWSAPVVVSPDENRFAHDKNWIVCDNGPTSPYAGRCYVAWAANDFALELATSSDGGLTWSPSTTFAGIRGSGWQPLAQQDGTLVIVYERENDIAAVRSTDGGASFAPPVKVSNLRQSQVPGMRAPALPSAELDAAGVIYVAWHDCRYRDGCAAGAPNDIVLASSPDGRSWSRTRRVPTSPELDGLNHFVPGLGVDSSTRGGTTRLALAFSVLTPRGCTEQTCSVQPYFVSSATAGRTWSAPEALGSAQLLSAYAPTSGGRFLGDYISTSFVAGGVAVPVFAAATSPFDGRYHQGVFAAPIGPLAQRAPVLGLGSPRITQARARMSVTVPVTRPASAASLTCRASSTRVRLRLAARGVNGRTAVCTWVIRPAPRGARITGSLTVTTPELEATRRFAYRMR